MIIGALLCLSMTAAPAKLPRGPIPAISADSKRLVVADGKRSIGIYDATSLELVSQLKNVLPAGAHFISLSPSGKLMLISGPASASPAVFDAASGGKKRFDLGLKSLSGAWFSDAEDKLFAYGDLAKPTSKQGWALLTFSLPTGKLVNTEAIVGAMSPPTHRSTDRAMSTRDEKLLFSPSGDRRSLGKGTFGCVASTPGFAVFTWRAEFMSSKREPLMWVDLATPDERHSLPAIPKCDNAYLNDDGTRLLVEVRGKLTLWNLTNRAAPSPIGEQVDCGLVQGIAPDLSFALCLSGIDDQPVFRAELGR